MSYAKRYNDNNSREISSRVVHNINDVISEDLLRSGTIPYFVDPKNGKQYIVLARSRNFPKQYNDFGGKIDPGENWKEAAIRELREEGYSLITPIDERPRAIVQSDKCIIQFKKIDPIESFDSLKDLVNILYVNSMKAKCNPCYWETISIDKFSFSDFEMLLNGEYPSEYSLWHLIKILLQREWSYIREIL